MNQTDLAQMLEMMAAALRTMPAVPGQTASVAQSTAVPQRTLNAWLDVHTQQIQEKGYKVQTVRNRLGNLKHAEMTAVYEDDRGLTAKQYKRLAVTA